MGINGIELRHLKYFVTVAEEMHFRRASERLNIAQPPLSRAIQQLEAIMDCKLLDRSKRRVHVTEAGQKFLEGCRTALASVETAVDEAKLLADGKVGSLRLGYTDFAISDRLPAFLTAFQQMHSNIVLKPYHGVTSVQIERLVTGDLDIGFVTGPIDFDGLETFLVQRERFVCILYEDHKFAKRKSLKLKELARENFVHGPAKDWGNFQNKLFPLCRKAGFQPKIVQEAFNSAAILSLVAGRMGITILTESTARSAIPGLISVPIDDVSERLETFAVWKATKSDGSTETFIDFLKNHRSD